MRVVHVAPSYYPLIGGAETYVKTVSEGLVRRGHEVLVVTSRGSDAFAGRPVHAPVARERVNGVHVRRLRSGRVLDAILERTGRWPGGYRLARHAIGDAGLRDPGWWSLGWRARGRIRRFRPDIVSVFNWYFMGLAAAIADARRPANVSLVGVPFFHTEESWSRRPHYGEIVRRYDAMVLATEHERRFVESLTTGGPRLHVVGVGVTPAAYERRNGHALRERLGLGVAPVVGFIGRLDPTKGVIGLIEAMPVVWRRCPDARLVLAGHPFRAGSRPHRAIADALARVAPDAHGRIVQVEQPTEAEKPSLFDAFDVYAMPSLSESFGIAYLEAWLCGKPVMGANVGSTPSVIRDGVDGILVDPRDPRAIADAMVSLLTDPERRARMGRAGYERTIRERTWEHVMDAVASLYDALVEGRRRRAMLPPP